MLVTQVFPSPFVPPHHIRIQVKLVDDPAAQQGIGVLTAAGMHINRIHALGDPNIIGPGAADAADFRNPRGVLKAGHNPGDSTLRQTFVHYVGLGHSHERLGDIDIIDHHRQRTVIFLCRIHGHPRQIVYSL